MWIKRSEYNELKKMKDVMEINEELNKEVKRLAELISSRTTDCKIGPWCKDCDHVGRDKAEVEAWSDWRGPYIKAVEGKVTYCKKHLDTACPEYERSKR